MQKPNESTNNQFLKKKLKQKKCKTCHTILMFPTLSPCCQKCQRIKLKLKKEQQKERLKIKKEAKRNTNSYLGKVAWHKFSKHVRSKTADFQGYASCFTCGRTYQWKELQAGHCFHRGRQQWKALDFDPLHIRPQCMGDNGPKGGMTAEFTLRLVDELGLEAVKEFERRRVQELPLTPEELKEIIKLYSV